ncbi:hypothetical protein A3D77_07520 [Candidatus Gottesmanbacteria bacterium RIFCSPHIGHO2_02_FULL_39_11]|uniref:Thioredoxin domain-containing protein n=1 Tax=Candidatus Gottesmanbacteria bacterium RIFCSPHIGHO2_02_FULL_39_11 TaxID=1798382 RepID=A0A1F5ZTA5_9BACT|nr:MAG: hypothetical protein A3D77_07520 [Candidatus Gottesmanbacteria bacterium RIFCSPHIGHO2_02_FULL_39_11]
MPENLSTLKINTVFAGFLIVASFIIGSLWTKVQYLEKGASQPALAADNPSADVPAPIVAPGDNGEPVKVSIDDDPVLGDKNAKVTLIDFSDYECPFCKRHFDEVYPQLKKDYIDTGKVKMVFRDLPLSFHQNAPKEAEAAECARKQGGDQMYYKYHDQIFTKTTSNGTGLALDQLPVIAKDLGLNIGQFQQCLDSGEFKAEVDKDLADAAKVGASGTPTFFIGKSTSNGEIDGIKVVGAQPYSAFKTIIDEKLK